MLNVNASPHPSQASSQSLLSVVRITILGAEGDAKKPVWWNLNQVGDATK